MRFGEYLNEKVRNGIYKPKEFHGSGAKIVNMGELFGFPRLSAEVEMKRLQLTEQEISRFALNDGGSNFCSQIANR